MKNIIKRIFVGVAIGMILYFLKGIAFIDVQAMSFNDITISSTSSSSSINGALTNRSLVQSSHFGRTFYGHNYDPSARTDFALDLTNTNIQNDGFYDINFYIFWSNVTGSTGAPPLVTAEGTICQTIPAGYYYRYAQNSFSNMDLCTAFGGNSVPCVFASSNGGELISGIHDFYMTNDSELALDYFFGVSCQNVQVENKQQLRLSVYTSPHASIRNPAEYSVTNRIWYQQNASQTLANNSTEINNTTNEINDSINSSDTSESEEEATSFFEDFENEDHGLTGIITAPLRLINSLASSSCSPLTFPLPFVDRQVTLPCMKPIYQQHFNSFLTIYQIITTGLIGYWISVKIFAHVKGFKNPEEDKVEVLDL